MYVNPLRPGRINGKRISYGASLRDEEKRKRLAAPMVGVELKAKKQTYLWGLDEFFCPKRRSLSLNYEDSFYNEQMVRRRIWNVCFKEIKSTKTND